MGVRLVESTSNASRDRNLIVISATVFLSISLVSTYFLYKRRKQDDKELFRRDSDTISTDENEQGEEEGDVGTSFPLKLRKHGSVKNLKSANSLNIRDLECAHIEQAFLLDIESLGKRFKSENIFNQSHFSTQDSRGDEVAYNKLLGHTDGIIADIVRRKGLPNETKVYVRAGPRRQLHFDPKKVRAAIVTCGGLCPGLNNVIRELTRTLFFLYGVDKVYGVRGGYAGFHSNHLLPIELTTENVASIHHEGGTILGSSRGGFELEKIISFLREKKINQLYIIGGDGTHRGANKIGAECLKQNLNIAVVGIPKTIDNDVDLIDRSFGFQTSVEAAQAAITSAKTEAKCNLPNGIGIVKLMGRSSGFIAVHSALASGDVDLVLVPEVPIVLDGPRGCLPHLMQRVKEKGHAVVVVAEGAGEDLLGQSTETDASGNKKLPAIGEFMKNEINRYFESKNLPSTVKYIDPSYMIRSVPANSADSIYCALLGQNAVHGAMAGFTQFTVGYCNNRVVYLPIDLVVETSPRCMDPKGRTWERVINVTRQPNTAISLGSDVIICSRTIV